VVDGAKGAGHDLRIIDADSPGVKSLRPALPGGGGTL